MKRDACTNVPARHYSYLTLKRVIDISQFNVGVARSSATTRGNDPLTPPASRESWNAPDCIASVFFWLTSGGVSC